MTHRNHLTLPRNMHYNQVMDVPSTDSPEAKAVQAAATTPPTVPSNVVAMPPLSYRAQLVLKAGAHIPLTQEGLPTGYYRIDLLPQQQPIDPQEEAQAARNAYSDLSFEYGYPTLPDGRPFWYKLDFEPGFAFGAFQIYIEQIDGGPRELHKLCENLELRTLASKAYCTPQELDEYEDKLIPKSKMHRMIYEFSILYFWRHRSRANDLYRDAAYRHTRLRRQSTLEEKHYSLADKFMKELQTKVLDTPEFWESMSAKTAVDLLGKLVAIGRISVGLPAAGPLSQKETPEDVTMEMILRTLGQKTSGGQTFENGSATGGRAILDSILQDKDAAHGMQELIVRVTRHHQQALPNPHDGGGARTFKGRNRDMQIITADDLTGPLDVTDAPGTNLDEGAVLEGEGGKEAAVK